MYFNKTNAIAGKQSETVPREEQHIIARVRVLMEPYYYA